MEGIRTVSSTALSSHESICNRLREAAGSVCVLCNAQGTQRYENIPVGNLKFCLKESGLVSVSSYQDVS
jgi:hypothetical protein